MIMLFQVNDDHIKSYCIHNLNMSVFSKKTSPNLVFAVTTNPAKGFFFYLNYSGSRPFFFPVTCGETKTLSPFFMFFFFYLVLSLKDR